MFFEIFESNRFSCTHPKDPVEVNKHMPSQEAYPQSTIDI